MDNEKLLDLLFYAMTEWFGGDPRRVQHFVKVHSFARLIGMGEELGADELFTLEAAAYVHDIGIKPGEERFNRSDGKIQEELGPDCAEKLLSGLGFPEQTIRRVSFLVGNHHTYSGITEPDHRILAEADFLVNLYEDDSPAEAVRAAYDMVFRTDTGRKICRTMFGISD